MRPFPDFYDLPFAQNVKFGLTELLYTTYKIGFKRLDYNPPCYAPRRAYFNTLPQKPMI